MRETLNLLCAGNEVFVKYQAQGGFNPNPPLRTFQVDDDAMQTDVHKAL